MIKIHKIILRNNSNYSLEPEEYLILTFLLRNYSRVMLLTSPPEVTQVNHVNTSHVTPSGTQNYLGTHVKSLSFALPELNFPCINIGLVSDKNQLICMSDLYRSVLQRTTEFGRETILIL